MWPWNASFRISSGGHYTVAFNRRALSSHLDLANSPLVLRKVPCLGFFFFFPDKHLLCPSVTDLLAEMPPNRDPPRTSFRWGWEVQSALHTQPPAAPPALIPFPGVQGASGSGSWATWPLVQLYPLRSKSQRHPGKGEEPSVNTSHSWSILGASLRQLCRRGG